MLKGYKTVLSSIAIVGGTAALQSLLNFDWVSQVGTLGAVVILEGIKLALRAISGTPIFQAGPKQ